MHNIVLHRSRLALLPLLVMGLLVLGSGPANAHAALVGSDPEDGVTLSAAPTTVTLTFNENVAEPAQLAVTAPDGAKVPVSDLVAMDQKLTATLPDVDKRGRYTVAFRVVSADGHPVTGTVTYDVTAGQVVTQVKTPEKEDFLHRHRSHLIWGALAAAVAIGLLVMPLRRRDDTGRA